MYDQVTLKEITTKIGSGSTPKGGKESYQKNGTTLIRSLNVYDFAFEYKNLAFINEEQSKKLEGVKVIEDDILLNITGASVGRCTIVPTGLLPARVNQHVSIIRINKDKAHPKFILYCINSDIYKKRLLAISDDGATREALTKDDIEKFQLLLPALTIQKRIASILSAYDDLIEVNIQRIKLLEETARELYKEWFVRMRFPGYKETKFVKGIPEGWELGEIGDVCSVARGSSPRPITDNKYFDGGTIPWIKIADATASSKFVFHTKECVNELGASFSRYLAEGSLIIATSGTLGFCIFLGIKGCIHDGWLYTYDYRRNVRPSFLYFAINSMTEYLNNLSYGAAIQNVNTEILKRTPMIIPSEKLLDRFYLIVEPIDDLHKVLLKQNDALRQIRDRLLPRLISGKLQFKEPKEAKVLSINPSPVSMVAETEMSYKKKRNSRN